MTLKFHSGVVLRSRFSVELYADAQQVHLLLLLRMPSEPVLLLFLSLLIARVTS